MIESTDETTDVAAPDASTAPAAPRRGRPRPDSTIQRDEQIAQALVAGGKTREDLATETGLTKSEVYLSLHRLRKAGRVERTREGGKHAWVQVQDAA